MTLDDLTYPILIASAPGIERFTRTSVWRYVAAEWLLNGSNDDAVVLDSLGREFRFDRIELRNPSPGRSFVRLLENFLIPPRTNYTMASVTASLELQQEHTLDSLKSCFCDLLATNPRWRSGVGRKELEPELQQIIHEAESSAALIRDMYCQDAPYAKTRHKSPIKTVDLRTTKRSW